MEMWINLILYLGIYSFLGWCCECIYCSVGNGVLINRGFLYGPFCPIYGFGAVGVLYLLQWTPHNITAIFLAGMILTSTLEYITSWIMEQIFHMSWWDYSHMKFNINGRICLLNSTLFGFLCVVLVFDLHPRINAMITPLSIDFKLGFLCAFCMYAVTDLSATLYNVLGINIKLTKIKLMKERLLEKYNELEEQFSLIEVSNKLMDLDIHDELSEKYHELLIKTNFYERRLMSAFPNLHNRKYPNYLKELKEYIEEKIKERK